MMENTKKILIKGAKVNNLKNIDLAIPRGKFIVITGLSGSGKSSIAFDTLYAEGQRRYVESLSSYARQFMGRMAKPECDYIKGIPPAIAIQQKVNTTNSRSTVGTSTEIYDYLRLLFARVGKTFSPVSGEEVVRHTPEYIINYIKSLEQGTRFAILSPIILHNNRTFLAHLSILMDEGYSRLELNGKFEQISDVILKPEIDEKTGHNILIDRLSVDLEKDNTSRLFDSIETAFYEGDGNCIVKSWNKDGSISTKCFSNKFEADGIMFEQPSDLMFNFNNPIGACPTCNGYGMAIGISEDAVIPDKTLSVYEGAVMCWRGGVMGQAKTEFIRHASRAKFPIHRPYFELTQEQKDYLWHGDGKDWLGIDEFFRWLESKSYSIQYRVMLARYRGKSLCPKCKGSRLKQNASYVKIHGKNISDLVRMPIAELHQWFMHLTLSETDRLIAKRLLHEINNRLKFMVEIGLGYLTLDRRSNTLSGGESQRINLATSLGSSLVGSLYILDEPSIGLHSRDTQRLIKVLKMLQKIGNTVIVVEHDEDIIKAADYLIDVGPEAGRNGGNIVYQGDVAKLTSAQNSYTLKYLSGELKIDVPTSRRPWRDSITITGALENNLKNIEVTFPLKVMTVVTGVSGSGKSTLIKNILYKAVARHLAESFEQPGIYKSITGALSSIEHIEMVDQNPIGKSTRSNPATYLKAYDEIRRLFADVQLAKQMGLRPTAFSFNTPGGRCEECKGEGVRTIEMQFMADITLECEACHGTGFQSRILEVEYREKNISDVLNMTINQAIEFFSDVNGTIEKRIVARLRPLQDVGLGYVKLGQPSSSLSGGESQRVKLAYFIAEEHAQHTMFIFDEPTTGLHFHDINTLLKSFNRLIERGHTLIIIEHNMDVIKCADYIIDMGPEGGAQGGNVVFEGTPEDLVKNCPKSYTAKYLAGKLAH